MRRYLISVIITVCSGIYSYAQSNINMIEILNIEQDMVSLENRITDLIKKNPVTANIQGLRQFHILWLGPNCDNFEKEDYLDHSFLYHLDPVYYYINSNALFKKEKKYLQTETLITDSIGNLIAKGDARLIHVAPVYAKEDIELAKMFFEKEIDFACYLGGTSLSTCIMIKGNKPSVIINSQKGLKTYSLEEYINCYLDEWCPWKKRKQ